MITLYFKVVIFYINSMCYDVRGQLIKLICRIGQIIGKVVTVFHIL